MVDELVPDKSNEVPAWRRWAPFVLGGLLLSYVASRLELNAFVKALRSTDYVAFLAFVATFNVALLAADVFASTAAYRRTVGPVLYKELLTIRGASYLPSILNHHVGQAWLTYFLSRTHQAPLWRVAGATLVVYATTFGALYVFLLFGIAVSGDRVPWLLPLAIVIAALGFGYMVVIARRPSFLSRRQMTAPLVELGVRGHLVLLAYRLPHVGVQFLGAWIPFLFFGVPIPFSDALSLMPIIMFVVALPVSPQGLGTRDALSLSLLSGYALGSPSEKAASIAATTLSWLCAITVTQLVLSLFFMRRAYRLMNVNAVETSS